MRATHGNGTTRDRANNQPRSHKADKKKSKKSAQRKTPAPRKTKAAKKAPRAPKKAPGPPKKAPPAPKLPIQEDPDWVPSKPARKRKPAI